MRAVVLPLLVAGAWLQNAPAGAQIMTGVPPRQPFVLPRTQPVARASGIEEAAMPAPSAPSAGSADAIHYLPNSLEGFRVFGEVGDLRWPIYLTGDQAHGEARFRLGYLSAISVLDDASTITVSINGTAIGTTAIDAPRATRVVDLAIPAGLLEPGYNAVAIAVRQRHRVDCSVAATYELWTTIDPTQTGLVLAGSRGDPGDVTDLPALLAEADGTLPIRVVLAAKADPAQLGRLMTAVQEIAIQGRFQQPSVDFGGFAEGSRGLNLVLGTRATLASLPRLGSAITGIGPMLRLVTLDGDRKPTLVVSGSTETDLDRAIAQLGAIATTRGTVAGRAAADAYPGTVTAGDQRLRLGDLGITSQSFSGRSMRQGFDITLPADMLAADYGRGSLDLVGSYASGLTRDARLRIAVNGHDAGQIALTQGGGTFRHHSMFLPLGSMRPGLNRIEIAAEMPRADDGSCDTAVRAGVARLSLDDTSELVLPALARIRRLPDLALLTGGGIPFATGRPTLVVPKPDRDSMAAAFSLVARIGVSAGRAIPFAFGVTPPRDTIGSILIVAPAQALDPAVMRDVGLDPKAAEDAWRDRAVLEPTSARPANRWWERDTEAPSACRMPSAATMPKADGADALDNFPTGAVPRSWSEEVSAVATRAVARITDAVHGHDEVRGAEFGPSASLVLAQNLTAPSTHVTTIVTAPDSRTLKASLTCLTDPRIWTRVRGRLSVLDAGTGHIASIESTHVRYVASETITLANTRLVVAGWFSLNPLAFIAVTLLTALCLSGTTLWFVRGVGRNTK